MEIRRFLLADYLVCLFVLLASLAIGVYYALSGDKQRTVSEYVLGNRKMAILPVATSMAVTYLSTLSILGYPVEIYMYGITFWLYLVGKTIGIILVSVLFVPLFYPLNLTSITELLFNGATLYGPTTIMETVAGVPVWAGLLICGLVGAICTTVGGYKGVIWTDTFQALVMLAGLLAVLIQCCIYTGGMGTAWKIYGDTGRLHVNVKPSLFNRMDLWSTLLGFTGNIYMFGTTQAGFQRYCSVPTKRAAYITAVMAAPITILVVSLSVLMGVVGFAFYQMQGCHPLPAGFITNANGIVPYFVMDILRLPGAPGLFVAACLCGSLSNVSSAINAAATLLWQDFLQFRFKNMAEPNKAKTVKVIAFACGVISIASGYLMAFVGGTLMKIANSVLTVNQVPLGLLFTLGGLFPRVNWRNALVTSLLVYAFMISMPVSNAIYRIKATPRPLTSANCSLEGESFPTNQTVHGDVTQGLLFPTQTSTYQEDQHAGISTTPPAEKELSGMEKFSTISFLWYPTLGNALGIILSLLLSLIPGFHSKEEVEERLLFPFVSRLMKRKKKTPEENQEMMTKSTNKSSIQ